MNDEPKRRLKDLCELIAKEQDPDKFSTLVAELNQLLDSEDLSRPNFTQSRKQRGT